MELKPIVKYDGNKFHDIEVGCGAVVYPINHPSPLVSNSKMVYTSTVLSFDKETGNFETENTKYIKESEE